VRAVTSAPTLNKACTDDKLPSFTANNKGVKPSSFFALMPAGYFIAKNFNKNSNTFVWPIDK
jgi:hypothetical protein